MKKNVLDTIRWNLYIYLHDFSHIPNEKRVRLPVGVILTGVIFVLIWESYSLTQCQFSFLQSKSNCIPMNMPEGIGLLMEFLLIIGLLCILFGFIVFRDKFGDYKSKHPEWGKTNQQNS